MEKYLLGMNAEASVLRAEMPYGNWRALREQNPLVLSGKLRALHHMAMFNISLVC